MVVRGDHLLHVGQGLSWDNAVVTRYRIIACPTHARLCTTLRLLHIRQQLATLTLSTDASNRGVPLQLIVVGLSRRSPAATTEVAPDVLFLFNPPRATFLPWICVVAILRGSPPPPPPLHEPKRLPCCE